VATLEIPAGGTYTEPGVTNVKKDDGTAGITGDVDISGTAVGAGTHVITYTYPKTKSGAIDDIVKTRSVVIADYLGLATFDILGPNPMTLTVGEPYIEHKVANVHKDDGTPGAVDDVEISGTVDAAIGTYHILYSYPTSKVVHQE